MKKTLIPILCILTFAAAAAGCSVKRESWSSRQETVQSTPADPVMLEKRTETRTETYGID